MPENKSGNGLCAEIAALSDGAEKIRQLSIGIDVRLETLLNWLGSIDGLVAAKVDVPETPHHPPARLQLVMPKRRLLVGYPTSSSLEDVRHVSLALKMAAVTGMPLIINVQREHQRELIARLEAAQSRFDDFATQVGIYDEEGE